MAGKAHVRLQQWIWRAFIRSALVPLVLVEAALIAIYLFSNASIRDEQTAYLRQTALAELSSSAQLESRVINARLEQVAALTDGYRNLVSEALAGNINAPEVETAQTTDSGVTYSPQDSGGSAFFYSGATPPASQDTAKIRRMATLDPVMRELQHSNPLIASVYFNSWDSYNHIYPWFDTSEQYPHDMVIPEFNFYYLADAEHNPSRGVVWTDVYLDPAGQGWMMSAIAPVYRGDFLEGVVGIDVTVDGILSEIGRLPVPWDGYAMLVSSDLNIMAMPEPAERDFGLRELTTHSYEEAIRKEIFKPDDFNLARRTETSGLARVLQQRDRGVQQQMLNGQALLVGWTGVEQTGWRLLTVVDEQSLFARTNEMASHYRRIGMLLIAGLVAFYMVFFAFLWARARGLTNRLLAPIQGISRMMSDIGAQRWRPEPVHSEIAELDDMAQHTHEIGLQLEQSQELNRAAQQRIELVLDSTTESIWEWHVGDEEIELRGRFCQRFGLPSGRVGLGLFRARVHPDDRERVLQAEQATLRNSSPYSAEFRFADAHGVYHWLLSRGRVLECDPDTGEVTLLAGTHVDIDDLKHIESDLRSATSEAEAANLAKARFISSMSHELRTPLNAILGFAQLMELDDQERQQSSEYVNEILIASRHLNNLLSDILDWSAIQVDARRVELMPTNVRQVMSESTEMVRLQIKEQGLSLDVQLPGAELTVLADPRRLRQVLLNLLSNAKKYNRPEGWVRLYCEEHGDRLRLVVEDGGLGIRTEDQARLFEPFQRLGRENTSIQGTGIGLSICREYSRAMGGEIGVESEPGVGTRFWVDLPLGEAQSPQRDVRPVVYCLTDDDLLADQVRTVLAEDAQLVPVGSTGSLLEQTGDRPAALVLLDDVALDASSVATLQRLRQHMAGEALPVLLMASSLESPLVQELVSVCQGLVRKPLDDDELGTLVRALLEG
ncbi:MAG TPA: histidine kinase [Pseudomonas sp.]|nr:histidine kinase [Pseudomonas sp.]HCA23222.1 histidine kinase [Pseudomonas sp.]|tara:strand:+ start:1198 stop:4050 length:2853 start_codon:yes stop_codon:yes gene_type:complete